MSYFTLLRNISIRVLALIAVSMLLYSLCLPLYIDILFAALALIACVLRPWGLLIAVFSLAISLIGVELIFRSGALRLTQYYREHEKYAQVSQTYRPNIEDVINIPHGDLITVDPSLPSSLWEPRTERFKSDSLGYRNDAEYKAGNPILVGDSFVVANGSDQISTLSEQLTKDYGLETYNIGFPLDPIDYENHATDFLLTHDPKAQFSFFFYEGNDFPSAAQLLDAFKPSKLRKLMDEYDNFRNNFLLLRFPSLRYPRTLFKLSRSLEVYIVQRPENAVDLYMINGHQLGSLRIHTMSALKVKPYIDIDFSPFLWRHVKCVFFIPTKARVYAEYIPSPEGKTLTKTAPSSILLQETFSILGINTIDLTPPLRERARTLLSEGRFVFWRDDTHWNADGISAAAPSVFECIKQKNDEKSNLLESNSFGRRKGLTLTVHGQMFEIIPSGRGYIDDVQVKSYGQIIMGWATDENNSSEGVQIAAFRGEEILALAKLRQERPDVEKVVGPKALKSGFTIALPLPENSDSEIELFALLPSGKAFPINSPAQLKE